MEQKQNKTKKPFYEILTLHLVDDGDFVLGGKEHSKRVCEVGIIKHNTYQMTFCLHFLDQMMY